MATTVLKNCKFYVDEFDLSSDVNQHSVSLAQDAVENTTFGSGSRTYLPGLLQATHTHNGFFEALATSDGPDDVLNGLSSALVTVAPDTGAAGEIAYTTNSVTTDRVVVEGSVGDMAAFSYAGNSTGQHYRGTILGDALTAVTSTGSGTAYQVGAIATGETGYASLHVVAWNATSLDVTVQSDDASGFPSATTQITFTQATGVTSEQLTVAGPVTDDWWRIDYTLVGTSATFLVTFGIA